jgi:hypothetical protein
MESENWTFRDKINWLIMVMRQNIVNFFVAYAQTKYSVLKNLNCFSDVCLKKNTGWCEQNNAEAFKPNKERIFRVTLLIFALQTLVASDLDLSGYCI